nr:uncharacterized protein LOC105871624 isoform X2 [Microcebus murinus]
MKSGENEHQNRLIKEPKELSKGRCQRGSESRRKQETGRSLQGLGEERVAPDSRGWGVLRTDAVLRTSEATWKGGGPCRARHLYPARQSPPTYQGFSFESRSSPIRCSCCPGNRAHGNNSNHAHGKKHRNAWACRESLCLCVTPAVLGSRINIPLYSTFSGRCLFPKSPRAGGQSSSRFVPSHGLGAASTSPPLRGPWSTSCWQRLGVCPDSLETLRHRAGCPQVSKARAPAESPRGPRGGCTETKLHRTSQRLAMGGDSCFPGWIFLRSTHHFPHRPPSHAHKWGEKAELPQGMEESYFMYSFQVVSPGTARVPSALHFPIPRCESRRQLARAASLGLARHRTSLPTCSWHTACDGWGRRGTALCYPLFL